MFYLPFALFIIPPVIVNILCHNFLMAYAGWRISSHFFSIPAVAKGYLRRASKQPKNQFCVCSLFPRPEPVDVLFLGQLKNCVNTETPQTMEELKNAITRHIRSIHRDADLCGRVIGNFWHRIVACRERNDSYIEHLLIFLYSKVIFFEYGLLCTCFF